MSQNLASEKKLQQKIHREELKLARLKTKANKERREDARLKLRLGGFLYLVDWQDLEMDILSDRIEKISAKFQNIETTVEQDYKILGENTLRLLVKDREYDPSTPGLSSDERRELNHRKITLGGLLVKFGLDKIERSILFGALLDFNQPDRLKKDVSKKRTRKTSARKSRSRTKGKKS